MRRLNFLSIAGSKVAVGKHRAPCFAIHALNTAIVLHTV